MGNGKKHACDHFEKHQNYCARLWFLCFDFKRTNNDQQPITDKCLCLRDEKSSSNSNFIDAWTCWNGCNN